MKEIQSPEIETIHFVTNAAGEKLAVQIDLKTHGDLWEDLYDILLTRARTGEPRETLDDVRVALQRTGKLNA